jgi:thiol-disulfide isomerase/thioredoxin
MRPLFLNSSSLLVALLLTLGAAKAADSGSNPAADKAWERLTADSHPPQPPAAWRSDRPSEEEIAKFKESEGQRLAKAADQAKDFVARYPKDARVDEARSKEYELLSMAVQLGNTNALTQLESVEEAKLKDPRTSEDERFHIRAMAVNRRATSKLPEGLPAALAELEKGARALVKDFPKQPDAYQMLLEVASNSPAEKARQVAKDISDNAAAPEQAKGMAQALLKKLDRVGKPVDIKFASVDGRPVDLAKLRGKVVLIDFWATWCGPCVREVPNVRATYQKLHPKGFEIVGISFDREKDQLTKFVQEQQMTWPQYFDGKQWENEFGKQFGIEAIPAMWLIDKKGNLRDLEGREDLADKVEKLLAENP